VRSSILPKMGPTRAPERLCCPANKFSCICCFLRVQWSPAQQQSPQALGYPQRFIVDIEGHDGSCGRHDKLCLHHNHTHARASLVSDPKSVTTLPCFCVCSENSRTLHNFQGHNLLQRQAFAATAENGLTRMRERVTLLLPNNWKCLLPAI
jgi:hypothetical protein